MQFLQTVVGMDDKQREECLQLIAETVSDQVAAEMLGSLSDGDKKEILNLIRQGGDIKKSINEWVQRRFSDDSQAAVTLNDSVENALDNVAKELAKVLTDDKKQKLHTLAAA